MNSDLAVLRRKILESVAKANEGHAPSALSILDLVYCWYAKRSEWGGADDCFLLSKGHASLALYSVLTLNGKLESNLLDTYASLGSKLGGHPDSEKVPELEISSGSLGHGLPIAVGRALAARVLNVKRNVFVLIGDGELNEGTNWESMLVAATREISGICIILDLNGSSERAIKLGDLNCKFRSFGFQVKTINGHRHSEIIEAFIWSKSVDRSVIIAETIKGYGVALMENNPSWHHKVPLLSEIDELLGEL